MTAMPAAFDSAVEPKSTSSPRKRSVPASRRCTPATILTSVDLPAPFSPTSAWIEPGATRSVPDRSARTAPKDFSTSDELEQQAARSLLGLERFIHWPGL